MTWWHRDGDEPLDLSALRTSVPLRTSDFSAIRARVLAEIRNRERRGRFAVLFRATVGFAALLVVVVALHRTIDEPERPQAQVASPTFSEPATQSVIPTAPPTTVAQTIVAEPQAGPTLRASRPRATRAALPKPETPPEPMRIEIHTADPDVRIIWIVDSSHRTETISLKENS